MTSPVPEIINDVLESAGFTLKRRYDEITTTAANLVMWSTRLGINKTDVISLFNQIVLHICIFACFIRLKIYISQKE